MWGYGTVGIWDCGDVGIWDCGDMGLWGCGVVGMWGRGEVGIWGWALAVVMGWLRLGCGCDPAAEIPAGGRGRHLHKLVQGVRAAAAECHAQRWRGSQPFGRTDADLLGATCTRCRGALGRAWRRGWLATPSGCRHHGTLLDLYAFPVKDRHRRRSGLTHVWCGFQH